MASFSSQETLFDIEKLDGTNYHFCVENCYNVLVQKKQIKPIKLKGVKPKEMEVVLWEKLDELARSTIMLTFPNNVYFNVHKEQTNYGIWKKLCELYDQNSAALQVYWLKQFSGFEDGGRDTYVRPS